MSGLDFDPDAPGPTIGRAAQYGDIITLPWFYSTDTRLGTTFFSSQCTTFNPWASQSPFKGDSLKNSKMMFETTGGVSTYRSSTSTGSSSNSEHVTASLGVTAGCKFLNVSVAGAYDRDVKENKDMSKASVSSSFRCGTVTFAEPPQLSVDAILLLRELDGLKAFQSVYGDYYIAGYHLGVNCGLFTSTSARTLAIAEQLSIEVKAKILFSTVSHKESTTTRSATSDYSIKVNGYHTLEHIVVNQSNITTSTMASLDTRVPAIASSIGDLGSNLAEKLKKCWGKEVCLNQPQEVTNEVCERFCNEGLVVEVLLLPLATLREVKYWELEGQSVRENYRLYSNPEEALISNQWE